MTETYGYFCPKCEIRWVRYLNKGEFLACGCGVKKEDAPYIYRKHYGNDRTQIYIKFKDIIIERTFKTEETKKIEEELKKLVKGNKYEDLLKKAIENALYGMSHYDHYWVRCRKCKHYLGRLRKRKCKLHRWLSIGCKDFIKRKKPLNDIIAI